MTDDVTNPVLDEIGDPRGILNTRACLRPHMQGELAAIGVGKKSWPSQGASKKTANTQPRKTTMKVLRLCTNEVRRSR